jgi:hypothetical protein
MFSSDGGTFILPEEPGCPEDARFLAEAVEEDREWVGGLVALLVGDPGCDVSGPLAVGTGSGVLVERLAAGVSMGTRVVAGAVTIGVCCCAVGCWVSTTGGRPL